MENNKDKSELIPCPWCGVMPRSDGIGGLSDIHSAAAGGYELRHFCFERVRGNDFAVRTVTIKGETIADVKRRWNGRKNDV